VLRSTAYESSEALQITRTKEAKAAYASSKDAADKVIQETAVRLTRLLGELKTAITASIAAENESTKTGTTENSAAL
jgi:hypothetical protein